MKVVAFNGSPRKNGNTAFLLNRVLEKLRKEGLETELVNLSGSFIRGCTACNKCRQNQDRRCSIDNDIVNQCIEKMEASEGILIGAPTYFAGINAETKALIDRAGYVARGNQNMFKRKVGAAVVAVRRSGALNVFQAINNFYFINEVIVPGSVYWNLGMGGAPGDVENDSEGLTTMDKLGENMAWILHKIKK